MARIKAGKAGSFIEVEGEQRFVEEIYQDFLREPAEDYKKVRQCITIFLLMIFVIAFVVASLSIGECWSKIIFGFSAGLVGLIARNLTFMSGGIIEKPGKNLCLSYLAYLLFVVASSLLIFGFLDNSVRISTSTKPYLFYVFLLPLNFYVGLMAYSAIEFLNRILNKL